MRRRLLTRVCVIPYSLPHGESGRSNVGRGGFRGWRAAGRAWRDQFEAPYGLMGPPSIFTIPFLRYMKETGTTLEQLAMGRGGFSESGPV